MHADNQPADPGTAVSPATFISWPPPELEAVQGRLWDVASQVGLGSVVLVLPLLWSVTGEQGFSSLGIFGERFGILVGLTLVP